MGEPPSFRSPPPYPPAASHLALPGFQDFSALARHSPGAVAAPSRPPPHFDNQHFMSSITAAHATANGAPLYDEPAPPHPPMTSDPAFDILDWYPAYQSCQRYFLDHAQHEPGTQALCALINIRLPFQYLSHPIASSAPPTSNPNDTSTRSPSGQSSSTSTYQFNFPQPGSNLPSPNNRSRAAPQPTGPFISLIPYLRRLTVTGFDKPPILHGLFGDDYARGVLPHLDCERRNYLFAAKSGGWGSCKREYDVGSGMGAGDESCPFMKPVEGVSGEELGAAEKAWSRWLAMEDWMVGPNAPGDEEEVGGGSGGGQGNGGGGMSRMERRLAEGMVDGVPDAGGERR